jgi:hypothetical protein
MGSMGNVVDEACRVHGVHGEGGDSHKMLAEAVEGKIPL